MLNSPQNTINEPTRMRALLDPIIVPDDLPYLDYLKPWYIFGS